MSIFDFAGREIFKKLHEYETAVSIDISEESAGIYILEISLESGVLKKKITKKD